MSFLYCTLLATVGLPAVLGAPVPSIPSTDSTFVHSLVNRATNDVYRMFTGNGLAESGWPGVHQWWSSFDEMFNANRKVISGGCTQFHVFANSDQETNDIADGIKQVSSETGMDARFILAVLLQESNGCVRAPTTNYGVRNPGLMQDHDGAATCNEHGNIQNPCPSNTIVQMIRDGVKGTPAGDGLVQTFKQAPGSGAAKFYGAARIYNSGSIDSSGDLGQGVATKCYSADIANRLLGWVYAQKACPLDGGAVGPPGPPLEYTPAPSAPQAEPKVEAASAPPASKAVEPVPAAPVPDNVKVQAASKAVSNKMGPGVTTECAQYYNVQSGDFCYKVSEKFGLSFDKFRTLNTAIDSGCSNLWQGYDYCVKAM